MIDPQSQALMDTLSQKGVASVSQVGPELARQAYLVRKSISQPDPMEVGEVQDLTVSDVTPRIRVRLYKPGSALSHSGAPCGLTVYFHGGGFVIGSIDTHDTLCRQLCERSGHAVLSVDYRLAPEHPFPAAFEDSLRATRWAHANAHTLGIDPERIAVAGDSAGGQLAAVVALALRDDHRLQLAFQLLIYPITDALMSHPSIQRNGSGYMLTEATLQAYYNHYWPDFADRQDWRASPILAPDLSGLPPAFVLTAGFDPLHDEGLAYADRLSRSGVPTQYVCFERQIHGFLPMGRVIDEATMAVDLCAMSLKNALK